MFDLGISFHSSQSMNSKTGGGAKAATFRGLGIMTSVWKTTERGSDSSPGRGEYPQITVEKSVWMDRPQACLQIGFEDR